MPEHKPHLRFILGRAGTGKTHYCLEAIRARLREAADGPALVFLTPEQATFQVERALVETPGLRGFVRAHVLSFRRLAFRVFDETGGPGVPPAGELKRLLIMKSVLTKIRGDLKYYGRSSDKIGFARAADSALAEWRRHGATPETVEQALARRAEDGLEEGPLELKLRDLALIERAYRQAIDGRYSDPEDCLEELTRRIPESELLRGAEVWVDGFADFTAQERHALMALMQTARSTGIALCLDPKALKAGEDAQEGIRHFAACEKTYWRIRREAEGVGIALRPANLLGTDGGPRRFEGAPDLQAIERSFLGRRRPDKRINPQGVVRIVRAPTVAEEVEYASCEALRMAREEGFRFREIGFILRDLERYHDELRAALTRHRIPFFLDRQREVRSHPLAELLTAAAQIAARRWRTPDVIQALKTDLIPISRDDADRIENHALARGLDGAAWSDAERWIEDEAGENGLSKKPLSEIHETATEALLQFDKACSAKGQTTGKRFATALIDLIQKLDAEAALETWAARARERGELDLAAEHRQIAEAILSLLEEWIDGLGETPLSRAECAELLLEGLASLRLRLVPPSMDQILIGSIERSRHPELRAVFVLGMNEGVFPLPPSPDPILDDEDRKALAGEGVELGAGPSDRLLNEPYLAYIALTRPRERLILSFAGADGRGRALRPSPYLERLQAILDIPEIECVNGADGSDFERISDLASLGAAAARYFSDCKARGVEPEFSWLALTDFARGAEGAEREFSRRAESLEYENAASLDLEKSRRLYGESLLMSATRLESQASCPFQCFARNALALRPREVWRLEALDTGQFFHEVLAKIFHRLFNASLAWHEVDDERLRQWMDESVADVSGGLRDGIWQETGGNRFLLDIYKRALWERMRALRAESSASDFQQSLAEAKFGFEGGMFPEVGVDLEDGRRLTLRGIIDRVDIAGEAEGSAAVRVIDYKTGGRPLRPALLRHGIQLQLPVYLLAATTGQDCRPGGFFYSPLFSKLQIAEASSVSNEDDPEDKPRDYKGSGLFDAELSGAMDRTVEPKSSSKFWRIVRNKDGGLSTDQGRCDAIAREDLDTICRHVEGLLGRLGQEMFDGEASIAPYKCGAQTACDYCDFRSVCRFDEMLQPWRELPNEKRNEMLEKIRTQ